MSSSSTELATGTGSDFDNILIFGCRKQSADFYYNEEWEKLHSTGQLEIMTAFSQDQWHKIYVQQILQKAEKERKLLSRHLLEMNGSVYIAGGPQMAKTVKEVIVEILTDIVEGGEKRALLLLAKLQREGRFCVEAWG
jgi:sulfite reductase alpha subunit-like flavoprotein